MRVLVCGLLLLGTLSCGASDGASDQDGCDLQLTVDTGQATVGSQVRVSVSNLQGTFFTPTWIVRFDGADYPYSTAAGDDRRIDFTPDRPGAYEVIAGGSWSGGSCIQARETINATIDGANTLDLRLRLTPPVDSGQAPTDLAVTVYGGADYVLGDVNLESPVVVSGTVGDGGTAIAAHIQVSATTGEPLADAYAGADGAYAITVPNRPVDITVTPADPSLAPLRMIGASPSTVGDIDVSGAGAITGQVTDPDGAPMAGAKVVLTVDGLPSSLGVTGGDGRFAIGARAGAFGVLEVAPPAGSGLPIASIDLVPVPGAGSAIDVDYAAVAVTAQSFTVTEADGATAAPGAQVALIADGIPGVAQVSVDGNDRGTAIGRVRVFATADGSGDIDLSLADGVYTVLAEPAAGGAGRPSMATADTTGGAAPIVRLAGASIDWTASLVASGAAVAGARVRARPIGAIAALAGSSSAAVSDEGGAVSLPLIGGASYEIQIDPPAGLAREHFGAVTAPASGSTDAGVVELTGSILVSGRVRAAGGTGVGGAHAAFYCVSCPTPDIPIAEGLTDRSGRFAIALPDPGLAP